MLISIDTLRADHLSCYGYHKMTTPNLDRIGDEGVVFENAYSTAAWTPPAHASMLTGLYPSSHGVVDNNRLSKTIPTLAEVLLKSGYKTAGFVNNSQVGELVGFERGHETFVEVWKGTSGMSIARRGMNYLVRNSMELMGINDHGAERTNQLAQRWIRENKGNPFYMFIHYIEPHNPINAPHPFKNKYWDNKNNQNIDKEKLYLVAHNPLICFTNHIRLNEDEIIALKALYDGEVSYLDHKIGELIEFLKRNHTYDQTLIIITADHGEHFGEHGLYSHVASLYEPILHIPLIIKYPEWIDKRARISELAQLIDIYPTVVEALDLDQRFLKGVQGTSLFETNKTAKYHDCIIAEWEGRIPDFVLKRMKHSDGDPIVDKFREPMAMIREGHYKYILNSKGRDELYDLDNDKREVNNISEKKNEIRKRLREELTQWQSLNNRVDYEKQSRLDEATKKNLKNLGYM